MSFPSFNHPFEIRYRSSLRSSYEGIPDIPIDELSDEEMARFLFHQMTWNERQNRTLLLRCLIAMGTAIVVVLLVLVVIMFEEGRGVVSGGEEPRRPHYLPTLLSVVDPVTGIYVYALNNTLYNRMMYSAHYVDVGQTDLNDQELPQLLLDKTTIDQVDESITLTWTMGRDTKSGNILVKDDDVIALYCGNDEPSSKTTTEHGRNFLEAATIAQARATSVRNGGSLGDNSWFIPKFPLLRQKACHFRLYSSAANAAFTENPHDSSLFQLIHVASTYPLSIAMAKETPTAIHLAFSNTSSKMIVQFTTGHSSYDDYTKVVPVVRYAKVTNNGDDAAKSASPRNRFVTAEGSSDTYSASELCQAPANQTEAGKFYPPGALHSVEMGGLDPATTYEYQVGLSRDGSVSVWSDLSTFTSAPKDGNRQEFSYIVYGDQGCPENGCNEGWKWLDAMMKREKTATAVHHFGDISYANGAAHIWDAWFQMITPFSSSLPLMIAVGNHEYDHLSGGLGKDLSGVNTDNGFQPSWGNFVDDSGGECGVPMVKRFRMPSSPLSNGIFWYSYNQGMVHTVVISSEHDISVGSPQYEFLEHDLQQVDRSVTPWVVLETHRPLYEGEYGEHWKPNTLVGEAMRGEIEDLLYDNGVDVVLAGHYHEYHRTCDGLYHGSCNSNGPLHLTIGSAGGPLDDFYAATYNSPWTARYLRGVFGYGRLTVVNDTSMHFEFVRHGFNDDPRGGYILDDIWVHRRR